MKENTAKSDDTGKVVKIQPIPENLPEELLPLYDWWKEKGVQFLTTAGVTVLVLIGAAAFVHYRNSQLAEANIELTKANSVEELEEVVAKFGGSKPGNAARVRLAKAYYDASRYDNALETYESCEKKGVPKGFEDVVTLGRAHALEALNKNDQALALFKKISENKKESFLYPQAKMGEVRVLTLQGKKEEAKILLDELKAEKADNPIWELTIANLAEVVDRYEPRAKRSLFDMADQAAKTIKPALTPGPATAAEPKPTVSEK
ncbi:MAG: tetratricopeptide repeat protein [Kiritimatiellia bacterium]